MPVKINYRWEVTSWGETQLHVGEGWHCGSYKPLHGGKKWSASRAGGFSNHFVSEEKSREFLLDVARFHLLSISPDLELGDEVQP